jgi:hypothetical protein
MVGIGGLDHIVTRLLDDFRRAHADQTFILHDEDNGAIGRRLGHKMLPLRQPNVRWSFFVSFNQ